MRLFAATVLTQKAERLGSSLRNMARPVFQMRLTTLKATTRLKHENQCNIEGGHRPLTRKTVCDMDVTGTWVNVRWSSRQKAGQSARLASCLRSWWGDWRHRPWRGRRRKAQNRHFRAMNGATGKIAGNRLQWTAEDAMCPRQPIRQLPVVGLAGARRL
jgi:hypothetical protein